jgi:hypothetical protein
VTIVKFKHGKADLSMNDGSKYCPDCHKPIEFNSDDSNIDYPYYFVRAYCPTCNETYVVRFALIWEGTEKEN